MIDEIFAEDGIIAEIIAGSDSRFSDRSAILSDLLAKFALHAFPCRLAVIGLPE
jgi:hypothetical protein